MAISKIKSNSIADDAITSDKVADGVISAADVADGTLTNAKLADGTIENAKLAGSIANDKLTNSSVTINGSAVSLGGSTTIETGTSWQSSVFVADGSTGLTVEAGKGYWIDTTSGTVTVTLPGSATVGDTIELSDYARTWATNNVTINQNSLNFQGRTTPNAVFTSSGQSVRIVYSGATKGWIPTTDDDVIDATDPSYSADFLVIAGGGGGAGGDGGNGGGGAGGYRNSFGTDPSGGGASAETSLSFVPGTVYTITVGGGGAGNPSSPAGGGTTGVDSSISGSDITTITSEGGGAGGYSSNDRDGGSGGGSSNQNTSGGSGTLNQGFDGGDGALAGSGTAGGGGGGAGAVGGNGSSNSGGVGGDGAATSITGSSVTRTGGGGAGADVRYSGATGGAGGAGGGGSGASTGSSNAGTTNTGSGGGAGGTANASFISGSSGGSGVVVLRVPTANYSATTTGSPTVTTVSTDTVMVFNSSGSYTG